jgi:hypothetical protein
MTPLAAAASSLLPSASRISVSEDNTQRTL